MKSQGKINVELENKQCKRNIRFEVVEYKGMPILGLKDCRILKYKLNEISEIQLDSKKENIDIFSGIGKFPDKIKIKVKKGSVPVISQPRRIPIKLTDKFKQLIEKLSEQKIIEKCLEPSEWQHPLVII